LHHAVVVVYRRRVIGGDGLAGGEATVTRRRHDAVDSVELNLVLLVQRVEIESD